MTSFAARLAASLPEQITLAPELVTTLEWLEANGHVEEGSRGPYGALHPIEGDAWSSVHFHLAERPFMKFWLDNEDVEDEVAVILRTGGDGSHAGIWRDAAGVQRFVHLGSGSGSVMNRVLTDSPVELLRLLAIGYGELCWPEQHELTPAEAFAQEQEEYDDEDGDDEDGDGDDAEEAYEAPTAFQAFVRDTFGVTIPERASEILGTHPDDGIPTGDPFQQWVTDNAR